MPEQASFAFYRIAECGYFEPGNLQPLFGDGVDTLCALAQWLAQGPRSVEETATFEAEEDADLNKVYCLSINGALHDPDFLLTTWNETPSVEGQTASVQRSSRVGAPSVDLTDIPNGGIPGYATYFWIVPAQHLLATIRFQHLHNGHVGLCEYMRGFLARHSPHTVYSEPDGNGDLEILGYRRDRHSQIQNLRPVFKSYPVRRRGQLDLIRQYRPSIRKIIRKSTMQVVGQDDRAIFQGVMTAPFMFAVGRQIPFAEQWPICDGLRQTAAIVFGVMGAWIAIVYPGAIINLLKRKSKASSEEEQAMRRVVFPLLLSTVIVAIVLLGGLLAPVIRRWPIAIAYFTVVRGLSFMVLSMLTILLLVALAYTFVPLDQAKTTLARLRDRQRIIDNIKPLPDNRA